MLEETRLKYSSAGHQHNNAKVLAAAAAAAADEILSVLGLLTLRTIIINIYIDDVQLV